MSTYFPSFFALFFGAFRIELSNAPEYGTYLALRQFDCYYRNQSGQGLEMAAPGQRKPLEQGHTELYKEGRGSEGGTSLSVSGSAPLDLHNLSVQLYGGPCSPILVVEVRGFEPLTFPKAFGTL